MADFIALCDGAWVALPNDTVYCDGVISYASANDILQAQNFITHETFLAYWPWALGMFAVAFGVRMVRRLIYSRS